MANEKILNTRIQLKYDTLANWNASTFLPKKGEVCIATVTTATEDAKGNIIHVPTVLIKVGDGEQAFSALPFVSAPAADVYGWAKKSEADFVAGFLSMKNGETTMQSLLDGVFATDAELAAAVAGIQGQIDTLAGKVSVAEGKITTLEGKVEALEAGTYDDTEVRGLITGNTNAINTIKDGTTLDSFKDVEDALAGKQVAGDYATNTALNAVKATAEAAYVKPAAGIAKSDLAADVQTSLGKADTALQSHQDISHLATKTEVEAKADKTIVEGISGKVTALEGKVDVDKKVSEAIADALQAAKDYADANDADTQYDDTQVKADIAANTTAISEEIDRAKTAEAKALTDAKAYTDQEINKITTGAGYATTKYVDDAVAAHETAVNTKLADYSTTEQMNAAIDADVLVETNRATGAEEALAGRIKALEDVSHDFAGADAALKAELQAEIDADVKALADGAVKANTEAIAAINDTENGILATAKAYTDEVKATILGENDKLIETYDTLSEIGQWIENTGSDVTDLATTIANETKAREDGDNEVNARITALIGAEETDFTINGIVSDMSGLSERVETIEAQYVTSEDLSDLESNIKGETTSTIADVEQQIADLAGEDRTTETVKGNADAIAAINNAETGILAQAKAYSDSLNHEDTKYTAAANGGLKLNADNSFAIDDSVVFVFDCGSATENIG